MRKELKWMAILLGGFLGLALIAVGWVYLLSDSRLSRVYDVEPVAPGLANHAHALEEGARLAVIRGCTDCHGPDLGGKVMIADPALGMIYASNLTTGEGGIGAVYSDAELARAIRHGVARDGTGLLVMPSQEYYVLSDADLTALVAYLRSVPPVDRQPQPERLSLLARALFMAGQLPPLAAEVINHDAPRPAAPVAQADAEFGAYLATSCSGCHGTAFAGGPVPGASPGSLPASNLTPAGNLGGWDEAGFVLAMRTGVTPEGKALDPAVMPWPVAAAMTDVELQALWAFLHTLPPLE